MDNSKFPSRATDNILQTNSWSHRYPFATLDGSSSSSSSPHTATKHSAYRVCSLWMIRTYSTEHWTRCSSPWGQHLALSTLLPSQPLIKAPTLPPSTLHIPWLQSRLTWIHLAERGSWGCRSRSISFGLACYSKRIATRRVDSRGAYVLPERRLRALTLAYAQGQGLVGRLHHQNPSH